MDVVIVADRAEGGRLVTDAIAALLRREPTPVLGLATGASPAPVYDELARRCADGTASLAGARALLLDEYVGLPPGHPQRYRAVVERELVQRTDLPSAAVRGPDGDAADLEDACAGYESLVRAAGVDLQLVGVGSNGHIAFNEPGSSLGAGTHVAVLARSTRRDNARFFGGDPDAVPRRALTQGVGTVLAARHVVLLAWGAAKADAVARLVEGPVTAMVPASALQLHPRVTVVVDEEAASGLRLAEEYRDAWAGRAPGTRW